MLTHMRAILEIAIAAITLTAMQIVSIQVSIHVKTIHTTDYYGGGKKSPKVAMTATTILTTALITTI